MKKIVLPGLLAGLVMTVIGVGLNMLIPVIFPSMQGVYENSAMFRPWSDPLMSLMFVYPFVLGLGFAWLWTMVKDKINYKRPCKRALMFALVYLAAATIPGMIISYSTFAVSFSIVLSWTVTGFINAFFGGLVVAALNK